MGCAHSLWYVRGTFVMCTTRDVLAKATSRLYMSHTSYQRLPLLSRIHPSYRRQLILIPLTSPLQRLTTTHCDLRHISDETDLTNSLTIASSLREYSGYCHASSCWKTSLWRVTCLCLGMLCDQSLDFHHLTIRALRSVRQFRIHRRHFLSSWK